MGFIIAIPKSRFSQVTNFDNLNAFSKPKTDSCEIYFDNIPGGKMQKIEQNGKLVFVVGDFIIPKDYRHNNVDYLNKYLSNFRPEKLQDAMGNFYLLSVDINSNCVSVFNSMLSILPLYHYENANCYYVSSRMDYIIEAVDDAFSINRTYIVEHLLFGYGLKDRTLYEKVFLTPSNSYLEIDGDKLNIRKHTVITDFFASSPESWKNSRDNLSDLFIHRALEYMPEEPYYSSLTGGLDGRTLLAIGLFDDRKITTYSYGVAADKDVLIPKKISKKIGLPYLHINLDENYAKHEFLKHARKAGYITEGNLRFSRASYNLLSEKLANASNFIVSGNFGSELMRSMRGFGNLVSHIVYDLFEAHDDKALAEKIKSSPKLRYVDHNVFKNEIDRVVHDCIGYKRDLPKGLTLNQKLYKFMMEELFRKYFGVEIVLENQYLINRTPFADFSFIKELFKTELAGCNANYRTTNPLERFKGQALYPFIIKKTYPELLKFKLDRRYSPADFLSLAGRLNIAFGFFLRKYFLDQKRYKQPTYNELIFERNIPVLSQINHSYKFVNIAAFEKMFENDQWKNDHINFNIYLSLFDYLDHITNKYNNVKLD